MVYFESILKSSNILVKLANFTRIFDDFNIDSKYTNIIRDNIQEILVCLMTLIHDSTFEFYDKNTARVYLCVYDEYRENKTMTQKEILYKNGVLALYTNYKFKDKSHSFPLFVSDIKLENHIDHESFMKENIESSITEIPWISAKRDNNKLKLKPYS